MEIKIVKASLEKLNMVASLFDKYLVFYGRPSDPQAAVQFVKERMIGNESVIFLAVKEEKNELIPLGFVQLYPSFSSVSMKRLWILNDLYVDESARRQGIAGLLLERAREHALETGAKGLTLETASKNERAQKLYESLGYERDTYIHYNLFFGETDS